MFKRISVQDAKAFLDNNTGQFVDIRDEAAFNAGHIKGSTSIGQHNLQAFIDQADLDAPLLVCCYHGMSSQSAAQFLHEKGFDDVYSIDGGFEAWGNHFPESVNSLS